MCKKINKLNRAVTYWRDTPSKWHQNPTPSCQYQAKKKTIKTSSRRKQGSKIKIEDGDDSDLSQRSEFCFAPCVLVTSDVNRPYRDQPRPASARLPWVCSAARHPQEPAAKIASKHELAALTCLSRSNSKPKMSRSSKSRIQQQQQQPEVCGDCGSSGGFRFESGWKSLLIHAWKCDATINHAHDWGAIYGLVASLSLIFIRAVGCEFVTNLRNENKLYTPQSTRRVIHHHGGDYLHYF